MRKQTCLSLLFLWCASSSDASSPKSIYAVSQMLVPLHEADRACQLADLGRLAHISDSRNLALAAAVMRKANTLHAWIASIADRPTPMHPTTLLPAPFFLDVSSTPQLLPVLDSQRAFFPVLCSSQPMAAQQPMYSMQQPVYHPYMNVYPPPMMMFPQPFYPMAAHPAAPPTVQQNMPLSPTEPAITSPAPSAVAASMNIMSSQYDPPSTPQPPIVAQFRHPRAVAVARKLEKLAAAAHHYRTVDCSDDDDDLHDFTFGQRFESPAMRSPQHPLQRDATGGRRYRRYDQQLQAELNTRLHHGQPVLEPIPIEPVQPANDQTALQYADFARRRQRLGVEK